jgi:hypothetical protein
MRNEYYCQFLSMCLEAGIDPGIAMENERVARAVLVWDLVELEEALNEEF